AGVARPLLAAREAGTGRAIGVLVDDAHATRQGQDAAVDLVAGGLVALRAVIHHHVVGVVRDDLRREGAAGVGDGRARVDGDAEVDVAGHRRLANYLRRALAVLGAAGEVDGE